MRRQEQLQPRLRRGQSEKVRRGRQQLQQQQQQQLQQLSLGQQQSLSSEQLTSPGQNDDMDLNSPSIPADLREFLKDIAIPPLSEKDEGANEAASKARERLNADRLKQIKSKVDTGGSRGSASVKKQPQKRRVKKQRHGSNDDSSGADDAVVGDADEDSSSGEESNSCKRGVERSVVRRGSGRMSEYEITLMWNQCKINFPKGRLNRIQLTQLLQQVFPKCDHEAVSDVADTLVCIFSNNSNTSYSDDTISFRHVLAVFAMSMKSPSGERERMKWLFRFLDEEEEGVIDRDDLADTIVQLCEFARNSAELRHLGNKQAFKKKREKPEPKPSTPTKREPNSVSAIKDDLEGMKLLSHRMGERADATRNLKRKQLSADAASVGARGSANFSHAPKTDAEEEEKEKLKLKEMLKEEREWAEEVSKVLDADRDRVVSKEEFLEGFLRQDYFEGLRELFDGATLWGELLSGGEE